MDIEVYDTVIADSLVIDDNVLINGDTITVNQLYVDEDQIFVTGYSHNTGDDVSIWVGWDDEVDLWHTV